MKRALPEAIYEAAIGEIVESLIGTFGKDSSTTSDDMRSKAETILAERVALIRKENDGFEDRLEKANVKAHHASLRAGHYKGLRHQLRIDPGGVTKSTAKAIVNHLFNVKGD